MKLGAQSATTLRIIGMAGSPLAISELFKATLQKEAQPLTVFDSVHTHCVLILVTLCYYCIAKFLILSCRSKATPLRPGSKARGGVRDRGEAYLGVHHAATTTTAASASAMPAAGRHDENAPMMVQGLPRLTIRNVWVLVYGLGLVFFVTGYCMLGLHQVCLASIALAMGVLAIEELVCPRIRYTAVYTSMRVACLLTGLVALVLVSCEVLNEDVMLYVRTVDLYSILFGLCLPFAAQFLMGIVRDFRHYALGSMMEVCEFGFPFAAFLGLFHLGVAYGQRFQLTSEVTAPPPFEYGSLFNESLDYYYWYHKNLSGQSALRTDGPVILFFGIAPLLIVPSVVCYVSCVLEGSSIDPLLSLSLALCVQHIIPNQAGRVATASTIGIYGMVCCCVACILRVLCEYRVNLPLDPYNLQGESTHLTERVVAESHSRRVSEMKELAGQSERGEPDDDYEDDNDNDNEENKLVVGGENAK